MPLKLANNAVSRLSASLSAASTTLGVMPGDGAKFPALTAGDWCPLTIVKTDGTLEIVKATARTIDTFTIVRAQEGTAATDFSAGDRVELRLTKAAINDIEQRVATADQKADTADQKAETANGLISSLDSVSVKKTGSTGAAILPEGLDAERPTPAATGFYLRLNSNSVRPEWFNRSLASWKKLVDEDQLGVVDAKVQALDAATGFTIIYPNGGTAAAPANVAINTRYVLPNPFPGFEVICEVEIDIGLGWGAPCFVYRGSGGYGVKAKMLGKNSIVVQTGSAALADEGQYSGNPFGVGGARVSPAPCRVKVWKSKGGA